MMTPTTRELCLTPLILALLASCTPTKPAGDSATPTSAPGLTAAQTAHETKPQSVELPRWIEGQWRVQLPDGAISGGADRRLALGEMTMRFGGGQLAISTMGQSKSKPYQVEASNGSTLVIRTTDGSNRVLRITFRDHDTIEIRDDGQPTHLVAVRMGATP